MSGIDEQTVEAAAEGTSVDPGARLAEAREALKLGTTDIARQLKLSVAQVEALEAGQFERLPGAVFVRGFIRNYARLVKLDPDELLRQAGNRLPQQAPRPETPPSQDIPFPSAHPPSWRKYLWMAAVLTAALAFYEFFVSGQETVVTTHPIEVEPGSMSGAPPRAGGQDEAPALAPPAEAKKAPSAPSPRAVVEPAREVPAEVPAAVSLPPASGTTPEPVAVVGVPAPKTEAPPPAPALVPAPKAEAPPPAAAAVPAPKSEAPVPVRDPAERQVTLVFEDESWVEIRDRDGKLILWQLNLPGTRQVVSGVPPLSFVIGNAHGVRLTYGDRPVSLEPYTKTDVARMTLE